MKKLIGIVFLLGTTICISNSLHSPNGNLEKNSVPSEKGPNSNPHLSISNIPMSSSNDDEYDQIMASLMLTHYTTTSSPAVENQEDQTGAQSSKNTILTEITDTKSPQDRFDRMQEEMVTKTTEQPSWSRLKQTEATDRILKGQECQVEMGAAFPKTIPDDEPEKTVEINQEESVTLSAELQEQTTKYEDVSEVDSQEKTPSCSKWPECSRNHLDDTVSEVANELMTFTLKLFKKLLAMDSRPNLVISPVSVALGLSHLMLGTDGSTKEDMLNALYKGVKDVHCIHEALKNLTMHDTFLSASEIFYDKELHIKEEFLDQSSKFYGSKGIALPRDQKRSLERINSWVSKRTNKLIPTLLEELPPDLKLILVNVIHYQGKWLSQFDPHLTKKENFRRLPSGSVKVPIMNAHKYPLQMLKDTYLQAQVARFPLSGNCSLLIFLPLAPAPKALKTMADRLSQEIVSLLITQLEEVPIRATSVSLPWLKIDTNFGMNDALSSVGLYDLFAYPNLCALSNSTDLAVSNVHHRAVLEIKEEGVKAAAATAVTIARTITVFEARKPFLFILVSDISRVPILIGHISDPSQ